MADAARSDTATPRLQVLLIAPGLNIVGGQSVQAHRLLQELRLWPGAEIDFLAIAPRFPQPLQWLQSMRYVRTILTWLYFLTILCRTIPKYEILHIFCASYWSYTLWSMPPALLGRMLGKVVIFNYRSGEAENHLAHWRSAVPTLRLADAIVAPSGYLIDVFAKHGLAVESIFNVIDATAFRFRERRSIRPVFLHNRGLEPLYNTGCTLRAFRIVQEKYPDACLTIAHDGSCRSALEALASELALRNVRFIGKVSQSRMAELYDEADIYLTSPDLDCMPGSLLECYASGLPLVATNAGGIPYIVKDGETGLLVNCNDHEAMAACALRLLGDQELVTRLTRQGFRELEKYSAKTVRQEWVALYRKLVQR